jgi:hypothetical protein
LAAKFAKSAYMTQIFFYNISILAEFDADFKSAKKVGEKVTGKS